jgi:hypothetical protein
MRVLIIKNPFMTIILTMIAFFGALSVAGLSESFASSAANQSNVGADVNENQTNPASSNNTCHQRSLKIQQ